MIPLAVAAAYLLANGAFFPFVEQVFMHTGGKGSIFTILFGGLSMALLKVQNWLIAVAAVLLAVNTGVSASWEKALRAQSLLFPLLLLLLYVNFEKEISSFLELLGKSPEMQAILLIDAVLTALLLYLCVKRKVRGSRVMLPGGQHPSAAVYVGGDLCFAAGQTPATVTSCMTSTAAQTSGRRYRISSILWSCC